MYNVVEKNVKGIMDFSVKTYELCQPISFHMTYC